jgi:2,4-dienoyl-CoA reductase-like NADH-dependent reductase (Old Yellow Enzyme family)/thioredoxin reductase
MQKLINDSEEILLEITSPRNLYYDLGLKRMFENLFQSGWIGKLELKNRVIKAPQWTHLATRDGLVSDRLVRYYQEVARGGTALIIVEFSFVDNKASRMGACQLGVADDRYLPGLSRLAQAIKSNGARAALQIAHCGRHRRLGNRPIKAPSRIPSEDCRVSSRVVAEELTFAEIQEIISAFADATRRAQRAGFDMVEVHGAHGYLITEFLSPRTNQRTDVYGGSLENRMRFLLEIVANVRKNVGPDYPVGVRLSGTEYEPNGVMIEDTIQVARALGEKGVNVVHISSGNKHQWLMRESPMSIPPAPSVWAAEAVKKSVGIPVVASGSITTPELAEDILKKGKADFVALGRPLFADPYWIKKAQAGRPEDIAPCIRCNDGCTYRLVGRYNKGVLCTVNVALGREDELSITPAKSLRQIAVVGGGPAGLEAARVGALRGHDVTLYEKRQLGGALNEASVPEFKPDLRRLLKYFTTQMDKLKIKVIHEEATVETIKNGGFDAVIVAAGGTPIRLNVPGADKPLVSGALDVLSGKVRVRQRVLMVGGGMVGTETGLFLAEQGKEVTFVEMLDELMADVGLLDRIVYEGRLAKQKVTIHTGKRVETILGQGVVIIDKQGKREEILADNVVVAIGFAPQTTLVEQLKKETRLKVYAVGDCVRPRRIFDAIHEGFMVAFGIR